MNDEPHPAKYISAHNDPIFDGLLTRTKTAINAANLDYDDLTDITRKELKKLPMWGDASIDDLQQWFESKSVNHSLAVSRCPCCGKPL